MYTIRIICTLLSKINLIINIFFYFNYLKWNFVEDAHNIFLECSLGKEEDLTKCEMKYPMETGYQESLNQCPTGYTCTPGFAIDFCCNNTNLGIYL